MTCKSLEKPLHEDSTVGLRLGCNDAVPSRDVQTVSISRGTFRLLLTGSFSFLAVLAAFATSLAVPSGPELLEPRTGEEESPYWWEWCTDLRSPCDKPFNKQKKFCDSLLSFEARARDIVSRITLEHYPWLLSHDERANFSSGGYCSATALPLDGIPGMNWGSEGLHGLAVSGGNTFKHGATSFPNVITTASSWNRENFFKVGRAIGQESRAFWNEQQLSHLAMWTPNINIVRDPRWGRAQETPGEDPYLTSEYAVKFVNGMQQADPDNSGFVQAEACLKHYLAYNFENSTSNAVDRMNFSAEVSEFDLQHTYLPMFERAVKQTSVGCVMCSYNAINGVPSCANADFLKKKLFGEWGFKGYVVSDCGAVGNVEATHRYTTSFEDTVRAVLTAGVNLECDSFFSQHADAFVSLLRNDTELMHLARESLVKIFVARLRLGIFESGSKKPFASVVYDSPDVPGEWNNWRRQLTAHQQLALQVATEGMVLLKNSEHSGSTQKKALPLDITAGGAKKISFIGPFIDSVDAIQGNYRGPIDYGQDDVTLFWGFKAVMEDLKHKLLEGSAAAKKQLRQLLVSDDPAAEPNVTVDVELRKMHGCEASNYKRYGDESVLTSTSNVLCDDGTQMAAASALAAASDDVVLVVGMDQMWEGEQPIGDRLDILLPDGQQKLITAVLAAIESSEAQAAVHLVVLGGAAVDLSEYEKDQRVASIVWAGYPSQAGGRALANLLLGVDPLTLQAVGFSGRLTTTWYSQSYFSEFADPNLSLLDMRMTKSNTTPGRGYRYYSGPSVVYPFGHGLTYAQFEVAILEVTDGRSWSMRVTNPSTRKASYVALVHGKTQEQLGYHHQLGGSLQLCNFYRVEVEAQSDLMLHIDCDIDYPDPVTRKKLQPAYVQMPNGSLHEL